MSNVTVTPLSPTLFAYLRHTHQQHEQYPSWRIRKGWEIIDEGTGKRRLLTDAEIAEITGE